ncbi:MAG: metal ABC transporter substrate-binding protein [Ilumatobacteraceae bacterium]
MIPSRMISVPETVLPRRRGLALAAVLPFTIAACSSAASDTGGSDATNVATEAEVTTEATPTDISVVATTTIWSDVTSAALCGLDVPAVMPPGADPHIFEPALADRATLEAADLVVANGLYLEEGMVDLLSTVAAGGVRVIELTENADVLEFGGGHDDHDDHDDHAEHESEDHDDQESEDHADHDDHESDDHDDHADHDDHESQDHDDHDHSGGDPHIWFDPLTVAEVVPTIVEAAIAAGADTSVRACGQDYIDELEALDTEIRATLSAIPDDARYLVTNHDAFGYFAARYDFEVVGTVIPSLSSLAETNPADLADLAAIIEELDIPAIFAEYQAADTEANALAEVLPGVSVATLDSGSLRDSNDSYITFMRRNTQVIAEALG